ncbi:class I SAM-dependent methyltransferase [Streptococcus ratti]|uniref:Class I SAM-dependent methyltransferase n=1 Tax=Streptococcus ratti TaxID=1341 RepID=A0A7X9LEI2_STRRT|nr:class I SAM-dependent methyltransferase [Streptococcus ratti]NMD49519.1 class I SAM-dependent methyltransferase [Streptococcus ratti]
MDFEKIETAYNLLLDNCQQLEAKIQTNLYDALIEQNAYYLGADGADDMIRQNNYQLRQLNLSKEEWRRTFQFLFIKAAQDSQLQANHQFTPDSIGFILLYLLEELTDSDQLDVLEIGSGTGNLAETLVNNSSKELDYMGIEVDDLLIDLSASVADVLDSPVHFIQEDAVRPQILKESDVIISDLPVGFYPNDDIAKRYEVAAAEGHTYAHHLLMEQSFKYLKKNGLAIFLAPVDLLTSEQSPLLKAWLQEKAAVLSVISLPEKVFSHKNNMKSIFILKKQETQDCETFVYPLTDLQNPDILRSFMKNFKKWKEDNVI